MQAGTNLQFLNLISKNQIQNACWAVPKPLVFCIRWMQAAHFCKMLFNLSADACGIGTFCTDGFPEAENSAMQHIRDCAILDLHKLVCPKKLEVFMATRTICFPISGYPYCREQPVTFTWIKGSKRQNIRAVHDAVHITDPDVSILEISSASVQPEGEAVSSLRLLLHLDSVAQDVPISTVFEAAKVFEHGGPFADLLTCEPPKVHKDTRLRTSGELLRYSLEGNEYPTEPYMDSFFEWLYCRALKQFPEKAAKLSRYNAFSDIAAAADSKKYYGDSSRAAAIYVGLAAAGKLSCIDSYELFIDEVYTEPKPLPKSGKSEAASTMTPEVSAPAKETPADELPQPDNANAEVIPDAAQMEHILELPKVTCLLLSLAKNAGLSANNSSELTYKGKEFLLDVYQKALKNKTLQINIQKNKITFPMEEPDSGFHAVGVLTRSPAWEYGWKFNYLTENTSGAEKSEVKEKIPPKPLTALEHLERCGYKIVQQVVPKKLPPIAVQRMAWKTGEALCDPVVVDFLQFIRTHMQSDGSFSFRIPKGTSKNSFATLSEIAQTWDKMGLFASIVIYPQNIVYELAQNETVRHFLSGKWLELFVEHQVQQILNRYQEEQGAEVSLCSNVILSEAASAGSTHELDVAFSINGKFFWVEAKSSSRSIDYGKYASLCEKLKVTSDRLLLVNSDLSVEECEGVSYFWNYRVANCATITQELENMIAKQIESAGNAALSID